ncbi:hypothetical protein SDC9_54990 [bioreactor metagenome]|uniref:Uncharacterized protein n=1 Tax=bioreactor metagenome TaxID=1076179 RepID=A0A644WXP6_9ZZZZ
MGLIWIAYAVFDAICAVFSLPLRENHFFPESALWLFFSGVLCYTVCFFNWNAGTWEAFTIGFTQFFITLATSSVGAFFEIY